MAVSYGFGKQVHMEFERALQSVTDALKTEGFGVLTEIDVAATLKQKLGSEIPPYRILGACNPPLAHRALAAEPSIGLLLPCNVVVRRTTTVRIHIEFMDPQAVLQLVDNPAVTELATEVRQRLVRVMDAL